MSVVCFFDAEENSYCWINLDAAIASDSENGLLIHFPLTAEEVEECECDDAADLNFPCFSLQEFWQLKNSNSTVPVPDDGNMWKFWCFTTLDGEVSMYW